MRSARRAAPGLLLAAALLLPVLGGTYVTDVAIAVLVYAMLGLGLNIVVGYAGLLDLGYAALFAIGAYTSALLALHAHLGFWFTLLPAVAAAGVAGVLIGYPTLRMHSDYLAIVTLGFGEIVRVVVTNLNVTGGPNGLYGIPPATFGSLELSGVRENYFLTLAFFVVVLWFSARLARSRIRRAWESVRQDEAAAEAVGVPTLRVKLAAYLCGALVAGLVGPLFAARFGAISPTSFTYFVSVTVLIVVVLGGRGSAPGMVVGALVVAGLPEALRFLQQWRMVIFALLLVGMMLVRPQGLWPAPRVRRDPFAELGEEAAEAGEPAAGAAAPGEPEPILTVEELTCRFGGVTAVDHVSLEIRRGEILSIIGPNGAGKTTAFNCITGVVRGTGTIRFEGRPVRGLAPHRIVALGIARTFQGIRLFKEMPAYENVLIGMYASGRADELREVRRWMRFAGVWEHRLALAAELPYGVQRRLEIARALAGRPRLLLLDEPAAGMNPTEKLEMMELIRRIRALGVTVVLIEHDMALVTQLSERVICMDRGRVLAAGTPQQIQADPAVVEAYLGAAGDDELSFDELAEERETALAWDS
ncbi:MAG: branched-chain amino acid transport system ATP-binding protein livM [Candidatus Eremiobacteraeota bacterium]|nr:branched-chain amino acid transport system ATP-binding protein livM [Candidatus Eremiobacteraeota bacterium]